MELHLVAKVDPACIWPQISVPCSEPNSDMTRLYLVDIVFRTPLIVPQTQKAHRGNIMDCQTPDFQPSTLKLSVPSCPSPASTPASPTSDMRFCLNADFQRINSTLQRLRTSGYYYEGLAWQQANDLLKDASVGTFLVRDSSDPRFLFSLSVKTERGPTSVRIHYVNDRFRLDSEDSLASRMPLFDSVTELVQHYVNLSQSVKGLSCVWLDPAGNRDLPIRLRRPLYKAVPSLQHLCRLSINQRLSNPAAVDKLGLAKLLAEYLREYPHHQ